MCVQGDVRKFADISLDAYGREQPCFNLDPERTIEALAERGVFDIPQFEEYLDSRGFR